MMPGPATRQRGNVEVARPLDCPHIEPTVFLGFSLSGISLGRPDVRLFPTVRMDVQGPVVSQSAGGVPPLDWVLAEFRLLVNESIRIALKADIRSRVRLTRAAYRDLSARHFVYKQYIPSAFEVALSVLKAHRRRLKREKRSSVPYMRRLMLKAENQSYWIDRETGRLRIPVRGTEGVQLLLPLSDWHRTFLSDPAWGLGSLTVVPGKVILVVRREAAKAYEPEGAIALDTNEDSLDGVVASDEGMASLRDPSSDRIQSGPLGRPDYQSQPSMDQ